MTDAREIALRVLSLVEAKRVFADHLLSSIFEKEELSLRERAFIYQLVYGVLRWRGKLDWIIEQYSSRMLSEMTLSIRNILRLGLYQILFLERVPPWAAIDEAVKLTARYGHKGTKRFVNGILREINRHRDQIEVPLPQGDLAGYLSVVYSHPKWLIERWVESLGVDRVEAICQANNELPSLTLRTNTLKLERDELKRVFEGAGISAEKCSWAPEGLRIREGAFRPSDLPGFYEGWFQVQDEASMLVSYLLYPQPGSVLLDACAAPGGKTTHLAQLMRNQGRIVAIDKSLKRLHLLEENCQRLGIEIAENKVADFRSYHHEESQFDSILIDAPCSGLGTLRRHPEGKWLKNEGTLSVMKRVQQELLKEVSQLLKEGGVLVYSTCSNESEENEAVIEEFLSEHHEFTLENPEGLLPGEAQRFVNEKGFFETFPDDQMDGMWGVRLRKGP
ncbi:MAG: 16S rRNA (cytosine(967)-C(5))-methyltransferase RsmB [Candidatus Tectomicrobia bacterium]|nr:16S rRNA (cytosine(967)-C(5))-methyltransferase RsmB [Candidatus Tectomicrobia bacterium]